MRSRLQLICSSLCLIVWAGCEFLEEPTTPGTSNGGDTRSEQEILGKRVYGGQQAEASRVTDRLTIESANLSLEIRDYGSWLDAVEVQISNFGGSLQSVSSRTLHENVQTGRFVVRIPSQQMHAFVDYLKSSALTVEREGRSGRDVSTEFFDLEARITNKTETEKRFREILEKAKSVEEVLSVERELSRLREEIDRLQGRRKHLKDRIEMSTVNVEWHEPYPVGTLPQGKGFWRTVLDGFRAGVEGFAMVLRGTIALSIAAVPAVFGLVALVAIIKGMRRWRRRRGE
jgi:hypothetical protein